MWLVSCLLVSLLAASHQLNITEFVVPASAEVGADVVLRCGFSVDLSDELGRPFVKWWYIPLYGEDDVPIQLYQRFSMSGDHRVDYLRQNLAVVGEDDILMKNVKYTDSGRYECEASGYNEKRQHADLIVFSKGNGPVLNISVVADGPDSDDEEDLLLECSADDVTPQPELVISVNGRPIEGVSQYESNSGEGLYSVSANVTVSKADYAGVEVRCELFYVNHNVTHLPFVDFETFNTAGTEAPVEPEPSPANITMVETDPEPQLNRSASRHVSWWLSIAAVLVSLHLRTLLSTSS